MALNNMKTATITFHAPNNNAHFFKPMHYKNI